MGAPLEYSLGSFIFVITGLWPLARHFPLTWPLQRFIFPSCRKRDKTIADESEEFKIKPLFYNHPQYCDNIGDTLSEKVNHNNVICGLSLLSLLVLYSAPRGFFPRVLRFSPLTKNLATFELI